MGQQLQPRRTYQRHNHRIHSCSISYRRIRNRSRITKSLYGETLEKPVLSTRSRHDLGSFAFSSSLQLINFVLCSKGWFVCAGLIYALIPGLNFLSCLAVSACLTPTDPILASAVVGGKWADKHVPAHIRHL